MNPLRVRAANLTPKTGITSDACVKRKMLHFAKMSAAQMICVRDMLRLVNIAMLQQLNQFVLKVAKVHLTRIIMVSWSKLQNVVEKPMRDAL